MSEEVCRNCIEEMEMHRTKGKGEEEIEGKDMKEAEVWIKQSIQTHRWSLSMRFRRDR